MDKYLESIDRYLDGIMTESEIEAFEKELKVNNELSDAFTLQKDMRTVFSEDEWSSMENSVLKTERAKQIKAYLKSDEVTKVKEAIGEVISERKKPLSRKNFIKKIAIAASILLATTLSYFIYDKNSTELDYGNLLAQEIENLPSLVNRSENKDELLISGQLQFEKKQYEQATQLLTKYQNNTLKKTKALSFIYNGLAYLELNDFENALRQFDFLERSESLQAKKAHWYKALIYLKQKDKVALNKELEIIVTNSQNYKYKEALKLLHRNK
ncbi:tetratricopeptide repeat protein [Tenacibaculum agarivorans]|uniref:tetratricopeptide repeat protein n=1 Tax=Tenacibaculum agarivorans TaxID=1908389 RepID=UPI00094BA180|nr:tetratricopeptide repeat protein [Tenacibaculum agarivorans]